MVRKLLFLVGFAAFVTIANLSFFIKRSRKIHQLILLAEELQTARFLIEVEMRMFT